MKSYIDHDTPDRHIYGEALLQPNSVTTNVNGASPTVGISNATAREDHQHGSSKTLTIVTNTILGWAANANDVYANIWFPSFEEIPTVTDPSGPFTNQMNAIGVGFKTPTSIVHITVSKNCLVVGWGGMAGLTPGLPCLWAGGSFILSVP